VRIALFDLSPYTMGGDRTWCVNVRAGLETLGHDVTYLRRNLLASVPDVKKFMGLDDLLGYDAVIFSDVYADRSKGDVDLPALLTSLRRRDVPTVLGLHGNLDQQRDVARRNDAIRCLKLASHPWTTNRRMLCGRLDDPERVTVLPRLPYEPRFINNWPTWNRDDWDAKRGILITGRISAQKGQRVLVNLADRLHIPVTVAGKGQFSSAVNLLTDVLVNGGKLLGEEPRGFGSPWEARTASGVPVRYTGGYSSPSEIPWDLATLHVNLTARTCSVGHLEYTTLEALDAGLTAAVPSHIERFYNTVYPLHHDGFFSHSAFKSADEDQLHNLALRLDELARETATTTVDAVQRDLSAHDPVVYVTCLLEMMK
jgi:hypothetical protein